MGRRVKTLAAGDLVVVGDAILGEASTPPRTLGGRRWRGTRAYRVFLPKRSFTAPYRK